jgi:lipopolysaccharide export system permease protein
LAFESYDLPIALPVIDQFRSRGKSQADELYLHELWRLGYGGGAQSRAQMLQAQAYLNFRLVEVMMMFVLPFLAIALAVPPKRSGSALGIFVGIVIVVAYHKVNQYAEAAGADDRLNPALALWVPFLALTAIVLWMYYVLAHKPGGQPIGALERVATHIARGARRLLPKARAA